jgi:RNA 3'-terminal phosphate cyclase (ATP)
MLTGKPMRIARIRARRKHPGLAPQHLAGVLAAAKLCSATVSGARIRSTELSFAPRGSVQPGDYSFDISQIAGQGSAGAVTLLLQTILVPLALADGPSRLMLRGGTHVAWSPPAHYVEWVLLPTLSRMGLRAHLQLDEYGWYPVGGGQVEVEIDGRAQLRGLNLMQRGELVSLRGIAVASNLPSHIPQRISSRANNVLREVGLPPQVQPERRGGPSTGTGVFLAVQYATACAGFSGLGEKGKPSEAVADEGAEALAAYHQQDMAVDEHLPDQLLVAMALADGSSALTTRRITLHTLTNAVIIRRFVDRPIRIEGLEGEPGTIHVD